MTQQATRHARRVYVGGLPPTATEAAIAQFFCQAMQAIGGNTQGQGDAVVNVYINGEKKFSFVARRPLRVGCARADSFPCGSPPRCRLLGGL